MSGILRPLIVLGTRPEAIKLAPVIRAARQRTDTMQPIVCSTGQHREMLAQVFDYFGITPDRDLDLMQPGQTLTSITAACLNSVDAVIREEQPDCVVVQGDTTTVMASAMVAFYHRLPVVHVEAGLRTGDLTAPWPEEFNRRVAGIVATLHCAPTQGSADALLREHVAPESIRVTGNTVIDALLFTANRERENQDVWNAKYPWLKDRQSVLITGHRRENFGFGITQYE
ncbi:MAG: UDP-N-acetylglucosamine 2-epimerase (non-hydrolyzing) [Planctomycetota bacterium]